jgi:hypothetical protein
MVSIENKMSMSNIDESFDNFTIIVKQKISNTLGAIEYDDRIDLISELFEYLVITKDIWRFHKSIVGHNSKFLNTLLNKISEFRKHNSISALQKLRVSFLLEDMEHRLDLFCSATTQKNKLCCNKVTHNSMLMCTMHKNKEVKKANMLKVILQDENHFPSDLTKLISLYVYS